MGSWRIAVLAACAVMLSQSLLAGETTAEVSALDQWMTYLGQGGKTIWCIGFLSVLGVGCALEVLARVIETVLQHRDTPDFNAVKGLVRGKGLRDAHAERL